MSSTVPTPSGALLPPTHSSSPAPLNRRRFLTLTAGTAAAAALAACSNTPERRRDLVLPDSSEVKAAEAARRALTPRRGR
ncbi:twin-arginine translocation signal domain-containing protein [Nocardia africana]|nr:twin-arginine translocation signal domain-containing protein [Nocardia sp. 852002-20019_SCH5090214]MCC3316719.1 twin-arginine translocation signal domain-containing protein [Nocardia africana]